MGRKCREVKLQYTNYEIYLKYKRMIAHAIYNHMDAVEIIAELNAAPFNMIETIILNEQAEEEKLGVQGYADKNRGNTSSGR